MRIRQNANSYLLLQMKGDQNGQRAGILCSRLTFEVLERERESSFSLDFLPFGPSVLDGARSKVVVRPKKFQFLEKWQNHNFGYEIVKLVKNP